MGDLSVHVRCRIEVKHQQNEININNEHNDSVDTFKMARVDRCIGCLSSRVLYSQKRKASVCMASRVDSPSLDICTHSRRTQPSSGSFLFILGITTRFGRHVDLVLHLAVKSISIDHLWKAVTSVLLWCKLIHKLQHTDSAAGSKSDITRSINASESWITLLTSIYYWLRLELFRPASVLFVAVFRQ